MSIADELKKLEDLRWNGTLTDAEFAQAKAALLAQLAPPAAEPDAAGTLGAHLAAVRYEKELERIDREWELEREKYMVTAKNGARYVPKAVDGLFTAVAIGVFGVFWTIGVFSIMDFSSNFGPPLVVRIAFSLFGVVFAGVGIWSGVAAAQKAEEYEKAHAAYRRRRAAVTPENFR